MMDLIFPAFVLLLMAGTIIPIISRNQDFRPARTASLLLAIAASILIAILSLAVLLGGDPIALVLYAPAGIFSFSIAIDRLAAFFLLIIAIVTICVAIYSFEYIEHLGGTTRRSLLCSCTNLFVLAMALVVTSADMLSFFFFWELMAAVSFLLVMFEYDHAGTERAGIFYLVLTQLSALFVMAGILLLSAQTETFAFTPLSVQTAATAVPAFFALFCGFAIKSGIIPFHKWLPYAHPASPSPISALMSGVMLKVAVYGLLRFLLDVFPPELWQGILILAAGTISAVLGVIYALKEHDLKAMLAYSSIENIGIIFMGIGLYVILGASGLPALAIIALLGALFHSLNHALFKSLLFLTAGSVVHATGTRDIEHMGGLIHRMPKTAVLFFTGTIAIAALPPLNGFASELLIFTTFFSAVSEVEPVLKVILFLCLALFALTSALCAACFVKAFGSVFLGLPRSPESDNAEEVPALMTAGPAVLAAACITLGLFAFQIFALAGFIVPIPDMLLIGLLLLLMAGLTYAALKFTSPYPARVSETWGCGTPSQQSGAEYTGHGFSEPLDIIFSPLYRTRIQSEREFFDDRQVIFRHGTAEIRLLKVFEEYLYLPIARGSVELSARIARFQNGCLDTYLLYVFVTVIVLLVFLGWQP